MHNYFRDCHTNLTEKAVTLRHLDPANVLKRGYAMLLRNGQVLTKAAAVQPGDALQVRLADGSVQVISQ
jgi:exodeoxyribonuclease VII large subunit